MLTPPVLQSGIWLLRHTPTPSDSGQSIGGGSAATVGVNIPPGCKEHCSTGNGKSDEQRQKPPEVASLAIIKLQNK